jgi:hypothetical protein
MHSLKFEAPARDVKRTGHLEQFNPVVALNDAEYFPFSQSVQTSFAMEALYFPPKHCWHEPVVRCENPASQRQLELCAAPVTVEDLPSMHASQGLDPCVALYLPAWHALHVVRLFPV